MSRSSLWHDAPLKVDGVDKAVDIDRHDERRSPQLLDEVGGGRAGSDQRPMVLQGDRTQVVDRRAVKTAKGTSSDQIGPVDRT